METATQHQPDHIRDDAPLTWAASHFEFVSSELLRDSPWARTWRLREADTSAYLKIVPDHQRAVVQSTALLAQHYRQQTPAVIADDPEKGCLLSADHGGQVLRYDSPETQQCKILATYAQLQVSALAKRDLLASLPAPELDTLLSRFLDFLQPEDGASDDAPEQVRAQYFIGRREARRYYRVLCKARALLEQHLAPAAVLPLTLCHGDLRPPNAAIRKGGECVLCDWDDACAGPAGFSLHAMFSGCLIPTLLLSTEDQPEVSASVGPHHAQRLETYLSELTRGGYADEATLRKALPAAICAGVLQYLLNFSKYPRDSRSYRKAVERNIKRRLSDLLDVCDMLASRQQSTAQLLFRHYEKTRQLPRAEHILQRYLVQNQREAGAVVALARVQNARGKRDAALETYRRALQLVPDHAAAHNGLGEVLMARLELEEARAAFARAGSIDPGFTAAHESLQRATALLDMQSRSAARDAVPTLTVDADESASERLRPEKRALAASWYAKYGVLQIDNVFPVDMIQRLQDAFFTRYTSYFRKDNHPDALRLGDQRYMLTVDLDPPFNDPRLYASPFVLPIVQEQLGDECILGAFTAVISLPGAGKQSLHKDAGALFPATQWHHCLPSFAIQLIVPLVPLDTEVGTTRVIKGSHAVPLKQAKGMDSQDPVVPLGSCLLTDYRVGHRGLANRSDRVRPILTLIYNRPWFRDPVNYAKQPPLRLSDDEYAQIPVRHQSLFRWWKDDRRR